MRKFLAMRQPNSFPRREFAALALVVIAAAALWLALLRHLAAHWTANPQYAFGWLVPALAAYLAARRWNSRPQPEPQPSGGWKAAAALLAAAFFPAWLVAQPNPDWRLVSWALALIVPAFSLALAGAAGGGKWARHFAFPALFIIAAVPWPSGIEQPIVQSLMRWVAATTVELLNLFGAPAVQHGNLIEVASGTLGVDEACSGVRSLQATIMAALFIGEMERFDLSRRAALLVSAVAAAFLTNVTRTLFLSWSAARGGLGNVGTWHDPAGYTILTVCLVIVWLVAIWIGKGAPAPLAKPDTTPAHRPRIGFAAGLAVWVAFVFIATEAWFSSAEKLPQQRWSIVPPTDSREVKIEPAAAEMLRADRSLSRSWQRAGGVDWVGYFFEWNAGPSRSRILARMHRPENCLPSAGLKLSADRGTITIDAVGFALPFRALTFDDARGRIFVYFCLWQDGAEQPRNDESTRVASLRAVLRRERNLGQRVAEFVAFGFSDPAKADAAFREEITRLVRRDEAQSVVPK